MTGRVFRRGEFACPKCGNPRFVVERCCDVYRSGANGATQTFWNGEPTPARVVRVVVGKSPRETWWCANLAGDEREAVEVNYHGDKFYLDNEGGTGWAKVTHGRGSPQWGHSSLPVERVVEAEQ